jgi:hypothetical protein
LPVSSELLSIVTPEGVVPPWEYELHSLVTSSGSINGKGTGTTGTTKTTTTKTPNEVLKSPVLTFKVGLEGIVGEGVKTLNETLGSSSSNNTIDLSTYKTQYITIDGKTIDLSKLTPQQQYELYNEITNILGLNVIVPDNQQVTISEMLTYVSPDLTYLSPSEIKELVGALNYLESTGNVPPPSYRALGAVNQLYKILTSGNGLNTQIAVMPSSTLTVNGQTIDLSNLSVTAKYELLQQIMNNLSNIPPNELPNYLSAAAYLVNTIPLNTLIPTSRSGPFGELTNEQVQNIINKINNYYNSVTLSSLSNYMLSTNPKWSTLSSVATSTLSAGVQNPVNLQNLSISEKQGYLNALMNALQQYNTPNTIPPSQFYNWIGTATYLVQNSGLPQSQQQQYLNQLSNWFNSYNKSLSQQLGFPQGTTLTPQEVLQLTNTASLSPQQALQQFVTLQTMINPSSSSTSTKNAPQSSQPAWATGLENTMAGTYEQWNKINPYLAIILGGLGGFETGLARGVGVPVLGLVDLGLNLIPFVGSEASKEYNQYIFNPYMEATGAIYHGLQQGAEESGQVAEMPGWLSGLPSWAKQILFGYNTNEWSPVSIGATVGNWLPIVATLGLAAPEEGALAPIRAFSEGIVSIDPMTYLFGGIGKTLGALGEVSYGLGARLTTEGGAEALGEVPLVNKIFGRLGMSMGSGVESLGDVMSGAGEKLASKSSGFLGAFGQDIKALGDILGGAGEGLATRGYKLAELTSNPLEDLIGRGLTGLGKGLNFVSQLFMPLGKVPEDVVVTPEGETKVIYGWRFMKPTTGEISNLPVMNTLTGKTTMETGVAFPTSLLSFLKGTENVIAGGVPTTMRIGGVEVPIEFLGSNMLRPLSNAAGRLASAMPGMEMILKSNVDILPATIPDLTKLGGELGENLSPEVLVAALNSGKLPIARALPIDVIAAMSTNQALKTALFGSEDITNDLITDFVNQVIKNYKGEIPSGVIDDVVNSLAESFNKGLSVSDAIKSLEGLRGKMVVSDDMWDAIEDAAKDVYGKYYSKVSSTSIWDFWKNYRSFYNDVDDLLTSKVSSKLNKLRSILDNAANQGVSNSIVDSIRKTISDIDSNIASLRSATLLGAPDNVIDDYVNKITSDLEQIRDMIQNGALNKLISKATTRAGVLSDINDAIRGARSLSTALSDLVSENKWTAEGLTALFGSGRGRVPMVIGAWENSAVKFPGTQALPSLVVAPSMKAVYTEVSGVINPLLKAADEDFMNTARDILTGLGVKDDNVIDTFTSELLNAAKRGDDINDVLEDLGKDPAFKDIVSKIKGDNALFDKISKVYKTVSDVPTFLQKLDAAYEDLVRMYGLNVPKTAINGLIRDIIGNTPEGESFLLRESANGLKETVTDVLNKLGVKDDALANKLFTSLVNDAKTGTDIMGALRLIGNDPNLANIITKITSNADLMNELSDSYDILMDNLVNSKYYDVTVTNTGDVNVVQKTAATNTSNAVSSASTSTASSTSKSTSSTTSSSVGSGVSSTTTSSAGKGAAGGVGGAGSVSGGGSVGGGGGGGVTYQTGSGGLTLLTKTGEEGAGVATNVLPSPDMIDIIRLLYTSDRMTIPGIGLLFRVLQILKQNPGIQSDLWNKVLSFWGLGSNNYLTDQWTKTFDNYFRGGSAPVPPITIPPITNVNIPIPPVHTIWYTNQQQQPTLPLTWTPTLTITPTSYGYSTTGTGVGASPPPVPPIPPFLPFFGWPMYPQSYPPSFAEAPSEAYNVRHQHEILVV